MFPGHCCVCLPSRPASLHRVFLPKPTRCPPAPRGFHEIKHVKFRIIVWRSCSTRNKNEADVIAARPLKDLDAKWAASDDAVVAFTKMVYNSFKRS